MAQAARQELPTTGSSASSASSGPISDGGIDAENAALAEEIRRLQEDNARLLNAKLQQEHALLMQENARLTAESSAHRLGAPGGGAGALGPPGLAAAHPAPVPPGLAGPPLAPAPAPPGLAMGQLGHGHPAPHGAPVYMQPGGPMPSMPPPPWMAADTQAGLPQWNFDAVTRPKSGRREKAKGGNGASMNSTGFDSASVDSSFASHTSSLVSTGVGSSLMGSMGFGSEDQKPGDFDPQQPLTTLMLRNIPNCYSRNLLLELLESHGFKGLYNLVYLPIDFSTNAGFGYAFVNFVGTESAELFMSRLNGFRGWPMPSDKVLDATWSSAHQGFEAHVERYRNSPVMHESVPDELKPVIFVNGERVPFPPPTKKPRAPRVHKRH